MRSRIERWLSKKWYQPSVSISLLALLPFSYLFRGIITCRRFAYQHHWLSSYRSSLPVIVVGNITLGGTGKTPFVIYLANYLRQQGFHPAIILRGVGGTAATPIVVTEHSSAFEVGDEAMLLFKHSGAPIIVSKNRTVAAQIIEKMGCCNIIISDDGLQHYQLQRDIEIILVDAERQFGNQQLLPAGPLREPVNRLTSADLIIENGTTASQLGFSARYQPVAFIAVTNPNITKSLHDFTNQTIHAVCGIGHPEQFLSMLKQLRINTIPHIFKDHHLYTHDDITFDDKLSIIMTEKDAVKCKEIANENAWYLAVQLIIDEEFKKALQRKLTSLKEK